MSNEKENSIEEKELEHAYQALFDILMFNQ
jgi:hypothetical protein